MPLRILRAAGVAALVAAALAAVLISATNKAGLTRVERVTSGSMTGTANIGDIVILHRVPVSSVRVGQIISTPNPLHEGRTLITHRIKQITKRSSDGSALTVRMQGDDNVSADPVAYHLSGHTQRALAIVHGRWAALLAFMLGWGRYLLLALVAAVVALWAMARPAEGEAAPTATLNAEPVEVC